MFDDKSNGNKTVPIQKGNESHSEVHQLSSGVEDSGFDHDAPANSFRLLMYLLYGTVSVLILSLIANIVLITRDPPKPDVYASNGVGDNMRLVVSSSPNLSQVSIINFAVDKATFIMSFNFKNIDSHLSEVATMFTSAGWQSFVSAMKTSKYVSNVRDNQEVVAVTLEGTPIVHANGQRAGLNYWKIEVPVFVSREAKGRMSESEHKVAVLTIIHAKSAKFERGLAIDGFEWSPRAE